MNNLLFVPITKVDVVKREVWGIAAQEVADKSGEIMDYESSKPNFEKWSAEFSKATDGISLGNVREMHGKSAAGKLTFFKGNDKDKSFEICAKVVDDMAWKKVTEGVYTGFSIGGSYEKRWQDGDLKRYTAAPSEVSLVDNPCIPTATFTMVKADGLTEEVAFIIPPKKAQPMKKNLTKGMYGVAQLAQMIDALNYVKQDAKFEAEYEKDESEVPAKLQGVVDMLGAILVQMAQEEVSELNPESKEDEMSEAMKMDAAVTMLKGMVDELAKAGKRNSAVDQDKVQAIHDHALALGAKSPEPVAAEKVAPVEVEKAVVEEPVIEAPKKDEAVEMIKALMDRIAKLEKEPAAVKAASPVAFVLGKDFDTAPKADAGAQKDESPLGLIKAAHVAGKPLSKAELSMSGPGGYAA